MLKILAVDDSPMNHKVISKLITGRYEMESAASGIEALDKVATFQPDLILLDVTMPEMDGYECCMKLRALPGARNIPILFLSGRCGIDEKLKGYEVGGDDYITKPFEGEELLIKIDKHLNVKLGSEKLNARAHKATTVAVAALKDTGHANVCLKFIESSFQCLSIDSLVEKFFLATNELGLMVSVQIRFNETESQTFFCNGVEHPLEEGLMKKVADEGLFIEFGKRVVCNVGNCSLLIKNMPVDTSNSMSMMKDHLHTLMKGFHARVMFLLTEGQSIRQRDLLWKVIDKTRRLLQETEGNYHKIMTTGAKIFDDAAHEVEQMLEHLNIQEEEEKQLGGIMRDGITKMHALHGDILQEDQRLTKLIDDLNKIHQVVERESLTFKKS